NLLTWSTASEINNDHFELQRSTDGVNFETITVIGGQGTSYQINHYDFLDTREFNGTVYYRLKQVDFDGTTAYSNTISISNAQTISIFKSGENAATINGENLSAVEVFDMNGKLIYTNLLNKNVSAQTIHFDANSLSQGVYFVRVLVGSESFSQKLVY
ncbi:MAG: T9SS type A sorting domain-containing protein, partial [Flavobacteriales bacterium]